MSEIDWFAVIQEGFTAAEARKNERSTKSTGDTGDTGDSFRTSREIKRLEKTGGVTPADVPRVTRVTKPVPVTPVTPGLLRRVTSSEVGKRSEKLEVACPVTPVTPVAPNFGNSGEIFRAEYRRIVGLGPLEDMPPQRWEQFRIDADRFLRDWSDTAIALGWSVADIFGHDIGAPWHRIDKLGLVWLLGGDRVVFMDESAAYLINQRGIMLTFYRSNKGA